MPVTLNDLARACGCTAGTVSRALRDDPRISPEVRARIAGEARRQGYRPNLTARTLVSGRSGTLWFLVGGLASPIDHLPAEAASRLCRDQGLDLLVATHHRDPVVHRRLLERLRQGLADGAFIVANDPDLESSALRELVASGFPLAFIDRHVPGLAAPVATTDHGDAARQLVAALRDRGLRRVVNLHEAQRNAVEEARHRTLDGAVVAAGLEVVAPEGIGGAPVAIAASGWAQFEGWRRGRPPLPPGTVLCFHDTIVGDPPPGCRLMLVEQDFAGMAAAAWEMLQARIAGAPAALEVRQVPILRIRCP